MIPFFLWLAEREGFEPPVPLGTAVFKTAVIDHSTTFPKAAFKRFSLTGEASRLTFTEFFLSIALQR